jgi:hypothetical protein
MKFTEDNLTRIFIERLARTSGYEEALAIATLNAKGNVWLVGGIVSRVLVEDIYGIPQQGYDFDFLLEDLKTELIVPTGWSVKRTKHGNPTFTKNDLEVDLFPIATHNFIKSHGLEPTIENFFQGVPFTIQAIAFDVKNQRIVGNRGINALEKKEYAVNNREEAQAMAEKKGITVNERILKKAKSMGLMPVLLPE